MKYIALFFILFALVSCSGKTTVLLLPEDDGSVGLVEVKGEQSSQIINTANTYTVVTTTSPTAVREMSAEEIENRFAAVLKAQPQKPISSTLYFKSGSTQLVQKSKDTLQEVYSGIKQRQPCQIIVIGHSDRMGSRDYNIKLSLKRASSIEKIILASGLEIDRIEVLSYGENDPIVQTKDGISEPLNRRVEIIVR